MGTSGSRTLGKPPLPLAGEGWGGGASAGAAVRDFAQVQQLTSGATRGGAPIRLAALGTFPRKREKGESYVEAVVTPPSTTMVWPVMKVEASEPR